MWASETILESPAEYKRRHAAIAEKESAGSKAGSDEAAPTQSLWRKLWPF